MTLGEDEEGKTRAILNTTTYYGHGLRRRREMREKED